MTENIMKNYTNQANTDAKKAAAKNYKNCIQPPVPKASEKTLILDVILPPSSFIMLRVVNILFTHMLNLHKTEALRQASMCNVSRLIKQEFPAFIRNACKKLLNKVDILRAICNTGCFPFVRALEDFNAVVNSCFGNFLAPNYKNSIEKFK